MTSAPILLVEDNDDDADLTVMAFTEARIGNPIVRMHDGEEALDYLFARGRYVALNHIERRQLFQCAIIIGTYCEQPPASFSGRLGIVTL